MDKPNKKNNKLIKKTKNIKKIKKQETAYEIYKKHSINIGSYTGIPSIAARHTSIEYNTSIQLDVGYVPREVGKNKLLVLITHGHADHSSDICNCIDQVKKNDRVTIFVPAYCAEPMFNKIKCDMFIQKGRSYNDEEITKIIRIIGCKRDNGEFADQTCIMSNTIPELMIAELVNMGDKTIVNLQGRDRVMIEAFACYHTVDTCGYVIYDLRKRLLDQIILDNNFYVDINFSEDQLIRNTINTNNIINTIDIDDAKSDILEYDWKTDDKFKDIVEFSHKHNINMFPEIIDVVKNNNFTLKVRRLHFPDGMMLQTKNDVKQRKCTLISADFEFMKKYKINIHYDDPIPKTMFFGDTGSFVFNPKSNGYQQVWDLIGKVETVIIESTYLESKKDIGDKKYKKRLLKRHMFLFELYDIFETFKQTNFLLIHFSACYDKDTIIQYVNEANKKYGNVSAFI